MKRKTPYNSTYKKLAAQWLNEALCFVSSSVVTDSFRLRNRQLLVAANRYTYKALPFLLQEEFRRDAVLCVKRPTSKRQPELYFSEQGVSFARQGLMYSKVQRYLIIGALLALFLAIFQR